MKLFYPSPLRPLYNNSAKTVKAITTSVLGFLVFFSMLLSVNVQGAVVLTNPITGTNPGVTSPYTTGQSTPAGNVTATGISTGPGIGGTNANDRYNANNWSLVGIDLGDYFEFTITPNSGYKLSFTNFQYTGQASATGPVSFAFRSNANSDNYVTNIGAPNATGTTISLAGAAYQNLTSSITFRFYAWGGSNAAGTYSINDFTFNGTVVVGTSVNLSVGAVTGYEATTTAITITATAGAPVVTTQTVNVAVTGTGITAGDYTLTLPAGATISITAGNTTGTKTFTVVNDAAIEGTETAILTLNTPSSGLVLGSSISQNISIVDDDIFYVDITNTNAPAAGNIGINSTNQLLYGFTLTPNGSTDFTAVNIATSGGTGLINFRLIYDANGNGVADAGELAAPVATVPSLANPLAFSGFTQTFSTARAYLLVADVPAGVAQNSTFTASINAAASVTTTAFETLTSGAGNTQTFIAIPNITLDDNAPQVVAGNIQQGVENNIFSTFTLQENNVNSTTLTQVRVNTTGSYRSSDIQAYGFKLWYNTTNNFATATVLATASSAGAIGAGETITFSSLSQTIAQNTTRYFWVTADVVSTAVIGRTINAAAILNTYLSFPIVNIVGSSTPGGTQTIIAPIVPVITPNHTNIAQVTTGNMLFSTTKNILSNFRISVAGLPATLQDMSFTIGGTFTTGDLTNIQLYTNTTNTFPAGAALQTIPASGLASGTVISFTALVQSCPIGDTYFWITADVAAGGVAVSGHTVIVPALANSAFTFSSGNFSSNTIVAGGTQTITGPATKLVITAVSPVSPVQGGAFNLTIQAQDAWGSVAEVTSDTYITLTQSGGSGGFTFPNDPSPAGVILAGTGTVVVTNGSYSAADLTGLIASVNSGMALTASPLFNITFITGPSGASSKWNNASGTGTNWLNVTSNWLPVSPYPGISGAATSNNDIALFDNQPMVTSGIGGVGINMNSLGTPIFNVGAINFTNNYNFNHASGSPTYAQIGNSSTSVDGILSLWGANTTANAVSYPSLLIGNFMNTSGTYVFQLQNGQNSNTSQYLKLNIAAAGTIVAGPGRMINLNVEIQGSSAITFTGGGTLTLNPLLPDGASLLTGIQTSNTFTSQITVAGIGANSSILKVGNTGAFNSNNIILGAGTTSGILRLNGNSVTIGSLSTNGTGTANTVDNESNTPATLTLNGPAGSYIFAGSIKDATTTGTGALSITKIGTSTLQLTGVSTYTGTTTVTAGTLQLNNTAGTTLLSTNNVVVNGGILKVSKNQTLNDITLTSGTLTVDAGVTLTVNGTLTYAAPTGSITGTGTIVYGASGKLVYSHTSLQNTGIELPVANGPSDVKVNNVGGVSLSASRTLPGSLTLTNGAFRINGNTLTLNGTVINGAGTISGGTTSNLSITGVGSILGYLPFTPGAQTLNNLIVNRTSSGLATLGSDLSVYGVYTPTAGAFAIGTNNELTLRGTIDGTAGNTGTLSGSATSELVIAGTAGGNIGTLTFTTGAQTLLNLTMNRTPAATGAAVLGTPLSVSGVLTLTNGVITTTTTNLLTISNPLVTGLSGGSSNSYINGPLRRAMGTANASTATYFAASEYIFPVGKSTAPIPYRPASVYPTSLPGGAETFQAEYKTGIYSTTYLGNLLGGRADEYWQIDKVTSASASSAARIKLNYIYSGTLTDWTPNTTLPPYNANITVAHDPGPSGNWYDQGYPRSVLTYSSVAPFAEVASWKDATAQLWTSPLTAFTPFEIGYNLNTILPVTLLTFTGTLQNSDGKLSWTVANSKDLSGFELQHSTDSRSFNKLADIASNGNTAFSFLHTKLQAGTHYYRLLIKEKNGKTSYSQTVLLTIGKVRTYIAGLKQTVVQGDLVALVYSASNQQARATITDVLGRQIVSQKTDLFTGSNQWKFNSQALAKGMYFINIITNDGVKGTLRFLKE